MEASAPEPGQQPGQPRPSPLRFALTIIDGRAVLAAPGGGSGRGPGRLDRIALEVPGLRFPFDLSQGPKAFRSRRCRLVDFAYSVAPEELAAVLAGAGLHRFGLSLPTVTLGPDGLRLGLRASVAGRQAELTARLTVSERPGGAWRFALSQARLHGFLAIPAPLLLAALPAALGLGEGGTHWALRPPALVHTRGLTEWDLDLVDLVLVARLVEGGWRMPGREQLESRPVELGEGRVSFTLGPPSDGLTNDRHHEDEKDGEKDDHEAGEPRLAEARMATVVDRGLAALAEAAFSAGELRPAAEGFRRALAAEPGNDFARERLFQLLASFPDGLRELEGLCDGSLESQPDFALALTGKAVAAAELGRPDQSAAIYARLAAKAQAQGEVVEEAAAQMAAAEQLMRARDAAAASVALERVLTLRPGHEVAAQLLVGTPA
jgi:hypothetical protein